MSGVVRVAIPVPLPQLFDYLPPDHIDPRAIAPGSRILVPFGRNKRIGIVVESAAQTKLAPEKLKKAIALLDANPLLDAELLHTLRWLSQYYLHPLGEVLETALPVGLRRARALPQTGELALMLVEGVDQAAVRAGSNSFELVAQLAHGPLSHTALDTRMPKWRGAAANLRRRGLITSTRLASSTPLPRLRIDPPPLTIDQQTAISSVAEKFGQFAPFVLDGITGSGKTEVYLALAEQALARDQQVLVLVPEIGLTPQLLRRFRERLPGPIHVMHSDLADGARTLAWLAAANGEPGVMLGTRSAIFAPLPRAGLIVVDEEHDASYKQQEGMRYNARDVAVVRARALRVPVVLGSATPSLETLANLDGGRYDGLKLLARPGAARVPAIRCVDLRGKPLREGLAQESIQALRESLARGEQTLVFRNRRGYAPVLMCHGCGWHAVCERCDKPFTWHRGAARLRCHHCGADQRVPTDCPHCGNAPLVAQGLGTERMEQGLTALFPDASVVRIDRETTRGRDNVDDLLGRIGPDQPGIFVGTQMLAKGHDLPNLTLVVMVGVDDGLFSVDLRASERLAQLIVQVAGRAGRAHKPGTVLLQTHQPEHPLLRDLIQHGYARVAHDLLGERRLAGLPPYAHLALLRVQAAQQTKVEEFLAQAAQAAPRPETIQMLGPMPAPMPRRAGMHRGQLLFSAEKRSDLHGFLPRWIEQVRELPQARSVRWSLDVDPTDLY
ncbi:MAG: primosomal protein N' [Rudaea sp.]